MIHKAIEVRIARQNFLIVCIREGNIMQSVAEFLFCSNFYRISENTGEFNKIHFPTLSSTTTISSAVRP